MNPLEKLAVITALDKRLFAAKQVARAEALNELLEAYDRFDTTTSKPKLDGKAMATISLTGTEPKAVITDQAAFDAWAEEAGVGAPAIPTFDLAEIGRIALERLRQDYFGVDAKFPQFVAEHFPNTVSTTGRVLPSKWLEGLTKVGDSAVFDGTVVEGVEWKRQDPNIRVSMVDTDAIIGALSAGALDTVEVLELERGEQ